MQQEGDASPGPAISGYVSRFAGARDRALFNQHNT